MELQEILKKDDLEASMGSNLNQQIFNFDFDWNKELLTDEIVKVYE